MMNKKTLGLSALAVVAILFVALTMLSNVALRGMRLDLTQNKLYTVSDGTRNILANIDEPINLYFYFSNKATENAPNWREYANRVQETLEEFVLHSGGKLRLNVIDPLPFSEQEDEASRFGLQAAPVRGVEEGLYLGLAGTNSVDDEQAIPFFDPAKEAFLEYDLARLIYTLDNPKLPVVGLIAGLPLSSGFDPMTNRMREPWAISTQIEQLFEMRDIEPTAVTIEQDVDLLLIVHPKSLADPTLYAIDQFVMRGGKAMIFVDPHAEAEQPPQDPQNPQAAMFADRSSDLPKLFKGWGIEYSPTQAVLDGVHALSVGGGPGRAAIRHLGVLGFDARNLDTDDVISAGLNNINAAFAGTVGVTEQSGLTLIPLISTSEQSASIGSERFRFLPDPGELLDQFAPDGQVRVLAARIQGEMKSAFPGGLSEALPDSDPAQSAAPEGHLDTSTGAVNMIVVADTDMLSDQMWVRVQNFFGQRLLSTFANNGDFVVNAVDNLTGSSDLISVRGRATFTRPFEKVEELRRQATDRYRDTEQQLQSELTETEARLGELQSSRQDEDASNLLILSDAQRTEIEQFQTRKLEIRKQLRQVRRDLDADIEQLGSVLKAINIGLVPLLITLFALFSVWFRKQNKGKAS